MRRLEFVAPRRLEFREATEPTRGRHCAALESPKLLVEDVRASFAPLRESR